MHYEKRSCRHYPYPHTWARWLRGREGGSQDNSAVKVRRQQPKNSKVGDEALRRRPLDASTLGPPLERGDKGVREGERDGRGEAQVVGGELRRHLQEEPMLHVATHAFEGPPAVPGSGSAPGSGCCAERHGSVRHAEGREGPSRSG